MEKKSKREKLERVKPMALMGMMGEVAPQWVAKELNKIIDHLNSQDQEEDKYKKGDRVKLTLADKDGWITGEFEVAGVEVEQPEEKKTLEQIREEFDKERIKEWNKTAVETYKQATQDTPEELTDKKKGIDNGVDREDTPEQKEDKKLYIAVEDILSDYHIGVFTDAFYITKLVELFKNLLSEREVFTKDELFMLKLATNDIHNKGNGAYDEIGEKIERMLSKLNKKK